MVKPGSSMPVYSLQAGPRTGKPPAGNQSAVRAYEQVLEQKERQIRENIQKRLARIHEVERQLATLNNQLHVNVAPRKQGLEHLRHLIEEQSHKIDQHRAAYAKAKAAMEEAAAALAAAEQRKAQLSEELTVLVTQSAGAQLKKLEELSLELEHLTAGLPLEQPDAAAAANGGAAAGGDARVQVQAGSRPEHAASSSKQAGQGAAGAHPAPAEQQRQQEEARRRQEQQAAAAARARHVQLGGSRASSSSPADGRPPTRIPGPPAAGDSPAAGTWGGMAQGGSSGGPAKGPFRGFD